MQLEVAVPNCILFTKPVQKIVSEALNGSFCLLPHHVDFVTVLVPGILTYTDGQGQTRYVAVDEGVLVKKADWVQVSTMHAVPGDNLETLTHAIENQFTQQSLQEKKARSALNKLEAEMIRQFWNRENHAYAR